MSDRNKKPLKMSGTSAEAVSEYAVNSIFYMDTWRSCRQNGQGKI